MRERGCFGQWLSLYCWTGQPGGPTGICSSREPRFPVQPEKCESAACQFLVLRGPKCLIQRPPKQNGELIEIFPADKMPDRVVSRNSIHAHHVGKVALGIVRRASDARNCCKPGAPNVSQSQQKVLECYFACVCGFGFPVFE